MPLLRRYHIASRPALGNTTRCRTQQLKLLSHKPAAAHKMVHLEVESKFNITALLRSQLDNAIALDQQLHLSPVAASSLLKFTRQPDKLINDQYFDLNDTLSSQGIWVRRRTERVLLSHDFPFRIQNEQTSDWEAKVRVGGDYQSSQFEELVGEELVMNLVKQHVPNPATLQKVVDIHAFRESWTVREHVEQATVDQGQHKTIMIDSSSAGGLVAGVSERERVFRHVVGEVELTMALESERGEASKRAATAVMQSELEAFMGRHSSLFPTRPAPVGKLTAYFAWKEQVEG